MTENGAVTIGTTGATCCRIICRSCELSQRVRSSVMSSGVETSLTVNSKRCHVITTSGSISSRIAIEEMVTSQEDRAYQSNEPELARLKRRRIAGQTTVRDFSTSHPALPEMTKRYL